MRRPNDARFRGLRGTASPTGPTLRHMVGFLAQRGRFCRLDAAFVRSLRFEQPRVEVAGDSRAQWREQPPGGMQLLSHTGGQKLAENRKHARVPSRLRCWCEGENVTVYARVGNLSEGGLFLRTSTPLATGAVATVRFGDGAGRSRRRRRWCGRGVDGAGRAARHGARVPGGRRAAHEALEGHIVNGARCQPAIAGPPDKGSSVRIAIISDIHSQPRSAHRGAQGRSTLDASIASSRWATSWATAPRPTPAASWCAPTPRSPCSATTTPPSPAAWTTRSTTTPPATRSTGRPA